MAFGFDDNDAFNAPLASVSEDGWIDAYKNPSYHSIVDALRTEESLSESSFFYAEKALNSLDLNITEVVTLEKIALGNSNKFQINQGWDGGYIRLVEIIKKKRSMKSQAV